MGIASKDPRIVLRELRRGCTVLGQGVGPRPWASKFFTKDFSKERSEEYKYLWTRVSGKIGTKRDMSRPEDRTALTCPPQNHGHLAHGRGRPAPRSPRPWARTTSTTVTSPIGEDEQHHGLLAHGLGRPASRSPRPRARTTSTTIACKARESYGFQPV
ncbi:hypothetical protein F2Q69_00043258 [Brassica cretica]|uniref:Uncharacterized protein n=1 Tax=Brassica cretica TaxID=69181 RepID=A0A8S9NP83_BRACR|nr:hypothetical protein F2Q69_00043258 [Brassica cretica]